MRSRWSDDEAAAAVERWGESWGEPRALCAHASRLLGAERTLVLHGGGNTSIKGTHVDRFGDPVEAVWVKASGTTLAELDPGELTGLDLAYLRRLRTLEAMTDTDMAAELRARQLDPSAAPASIEALLHAWLPAACVCHTHADALLVLGNQPDGEAMVRDAVGDDVVVVPYHKPGFALAKATAAALEAEPDARAIVLLRHGVVTWGEDPRAAYEAMIEVVAAAEDHLAERVGDAPSSDASPDLAQERLSEVAPVLRGLLARPTEDPDRPHRPVVLRALTDADTLGVLDIDGARELLVSPVVTSDHIIRTKNLPLWIDGLDLDDADHMREQLTAAVATYADAYRAYVDRHGLAPGVEPDDPLPRVVLIPGVGALCAGDDAVAAGVCRDITATTLAIKWRAAAIGRYVGLAEADAFHMEYCAVQRAKLSRGQPLALAGKVALVTGGAGAIGGGVARGLLDAGCHVAVADLPGERLDGIVAELGAHAPERVVGIAMDATDADAVAAAFAEVCRTWGGVDVLVVSTGIAHIATIADMDLEAFTRLHEVNVEGTLLALKGAAACFARQGTGGDVVVVSTKNVFAPGASFGAYSATKAASHQLARIASLELAPLGVRVNMVAPDAVFADGERRSGLWEEVGPDRMRARGLDESGLEDYYRDRNLLKLRVTAEHVANAVLFFVTRQTPTTGATLPVDGGLPDATPR